jgi:Ca2+-binding EF-hand superfamily protein
MLHHHKVQLPGIPQDSIKLSSLSIYTDLRTAFDLLDRDQDGMVTPTELQFMLRNLGIELSDELIDGLMKEASKEGKF